MAYYSGPSGGSPRGSWGPQMGLQPPTSQSYYTATNNAAHSPSSSSNAPLSVGLAPGSPGSPVVHFPVPSSDNPATRSPLATTRSSHHHHQTWGPQPDSDVDSFVMVQPTTKPGTGSGFHASPSMHEEKFRERVRAGMRLKNASDGDTLPPNYLGYVTSDELLVIGPDLKTIWVPHPNDIAIRPEKMVGKLLSKLESSAKETGSDVERTHFQKVCGLLYYLTVANYTDKTHQYDTLFNPAVSPSEKQHQKKTTEWWDRKSSEFIHHFVQSVRKANFLALTQNEIDFADIQEEFLFGMPITIDWDKLDSDMLSNYFNVLNKKYEHLPAPPPFVRHALVFWRGLGVQKRTGHFYLQKVDFLLQCLTTSAKTKLGLLPKTIQPPSEDPSSRRSHSTIHIADSRQRITLADAYGSPSNISAFFKPLTLQEPTYKEVIALFRKAPQDKSDDNKKVIYIQRFHDIPMKSLSTILPIKKARLNWADLLFFITIAIWVATLLFKAFTTLSHSTNIDEAVLGLLVLLSPLLVRYVNRKIAANRSSALCRNLATSSQQSASLNCNKGLLSYLRSAAAEQEFKEAVIAYYVIWRWNIGISPNELDGACEYLLKEIFDVSIDFQVVAAVDTLEAHNLIRKDRGLLYPLSDLNMALKQLESELASSAFSMFAMRSQES